MESQESKGQNRVGPDSGAKGRGVRGPDATAFFKVANFELFVKPNKYVMTAGLVGLTVCFGYIFYINYNARTGLKNQYIALNEDNSETIQQKKSKWN